MILPDTELQQISSSYFEGRRFQAIHLNSSVRCDYFRIEESSRTFFLKRYKVEVKDPSKYRILTKDVPHLLRLLLTRAGEPFLTFDGKPTFLYPFVDGRHIDPAKGDNILSLPAILGGVNQSFAHITKAYLRDGYDPKLQALGWSPELKNYFQEKFQVAFTKAEFELLMEITAACAKINSKPAFEYIDCHPTNILVDSDGKIILVDIDSFATVPAGTSLGMLIERNASSKGIALEMYKGYKEVAQDMQLSFRDILRLSQYETLKRLNYILAEIQRTGATNWGSDFGKHLRNIKRMQTFLGASV